MLSRQPMVSTSIIYLWKILRKVWTPKQGDICYNVTRFNFKSSPCDLIYLIPVTLTYFHLFIVVYFGSTLNKPVISTDLRITIAATCSLSPRSTVSCTYYHLDDFGVPRGGVVVDDDRWKTDSLRVTNNWTRAMATWGFIILFSLLL